MEKTKTVLDREPISSDYISSRQDFSKVVSGYKALKPSIWKSTWFYGTAGLATIAIAATVVLYNPDSGDPVKEAPTQNASTKVDMTQEKQSKVPNNLIAQVEPIRDEIVASSGSNRSHVSNSQIQTQNADSKVIPEETVEEVVEEENSEVVEPDNSPNEEPEVTKSVQNMLPNISGFYHGEIPYFRLCDGKGLQVNDDLAITSFKVQFYVGRRSIEQTVRGNRIPAELCEAITMNSLGSNVYFTEIRAEHRVTGRSTHLNSMNLIPVN